METINITPPARFLWMEDNTNIAEASISEQIVPPAVQAFQRWFNRLSTGMRSGSISPKNESLDWVGPT